MRKRLSGCALLLAGMIAAPATGWSQAAPAPAPARPPVAPAVESPAAQTFALMPSPRPTENICQQADGLLYVTLIDDKKVVSIDQQGKLSDFVAIPSATGLLGVACGEGEIAVGVFTKTFRNIPKRYSDTGTHIMIYDLAGRLKTDIVGVKTAGINGLAYGGKGLYYGADSASGTIYRIDVATGKMTPWFRDDRFAPNTDAGAGMNGLKVKNGWLYFSGPVMNGIFKIRIGPDGEAQGAYQPVELGLRVDDFDVANDGSVYFPAGGIFYKVSAEGVVTPIAYPIQGGPDAVVSIDGKWVYWSTRGGTGGPQRVNRIALQ